MNRFVNINVGQLRVGMYVHLETGWLHHPFPVNSFKITNAEQLKTFAALKLKTVQVDLTRSDTQDLVSEPGDSDRLTPSILVESQRSKTELWRDRVLAVQTQFLGAVSVFDDVQAQLIASPQAARTLTDELVAQQVVKLAQERDASLHLLADAGGATYGIHGVNVAVLSLLLGKTLGLRSEELQDLGAAALLHDIGKPALKISAAACALNQGLAAGHLRDTAYAEHVGASVTLAMTMGYAPSVTTAIAQHHEWADGTGFPLGLLAADMDIAGQILALTNNFERLCNLPELGNEMTPHEAMASLYGQYRQRYAPVVLKAFVQTLGVYPPGSLVELSDGRIGVVVSVNTSQSLKPQVLTYEPLASQKMQQVDLVELVGLGIRRGLTRNQVPRKTLEALQPQRRLCYFFDSSAVITAEKDTS
ncbi:HD domain-containing phosphohydrolase [Comamonas sp. Y33R10-2]|uniref:HD-GYP domain-containing protein n=1 Tax=Comamonas sp. Y33R10-2 TaxID=2853257 RepID=UPI002102CFB1|nr:HD domain-containing phosphohydrolase [Comamonas sp. Y33R10-2]